MKWKEEKRKKYFLEQKNIIQVTQYVDINEERGIDENEEGILSDVYKDMKFWDRVIQRTEKCVERGGD